MKHFKNISLIATLTFALFLSSCTGITDANNAGDELLLQAEDMKDQHILEGGEQPGMIRVRPD